MVTRIADCFRNRRAAARRLPPLDCGHADPVECVAAEVAAVIGPERFGLTVAEARRHGNALVTDGWTVDEVTDVLGILPVYAEVDA